MPDWFLWVALGAALLFEVLFIRSHTNLKNEKMKWRTDVPTIKFKSTFKFPKA